MRGPRDGRLWLPVDHRCAVTSHDARWKEREREGEGEGEGEGERDAWRKVGMLSKRGMKEAATCRRGE